MVKIFKKSGHFLDENLVALFFCGIVEFLRLFDFLHHSHLSKLVPNLTILVEMISANLIQIVLRWCWWYFIFQFKKCGTVIKFCASFCEKVKASDFNF